MKLIYCSDTNNGIGFDNKMPWHCPEDFAHFKEETLGSSIVMGVNTWNSLPKKPLPNRTNIVVHSNDKIFEPTENNVFTSDYDTFESYNKDNMYLIGGARMYEKYIHLCDEIIKTEISGNYKCDSFFDMNAHGIEFIEYKTKVLSEIAIVRYYKRK